MKSVYFLGERQIDIREVPEPKPGRGDVVISMKASGLCGSDLHYYRSPEKKTKAEALVGGHEPCGIIAEVGDEVTEWQVGDRVMVYHYEGCGSCRMCRMGYMQMCQRQTAVYGATQDGCHQDLFLTPADTCVALPDELGFEDGAACSCGTGTAFYALRRLNLTAQDTIAVFGQGPLGLNVTLLAAHIGARVIAVDIEKNRLELASQLGADIIIDSSRNDPVESIKEYTGGEGADKSLDAAGVPKATNDALDSVKQWGHVCFVGMGRQSTAFNIRDQIIKKQLTMHGSWTFGITDLVEVAWFIADRRVPLNKLITHRFPLDQAEAAYHLFDSGKTGKIVLVWS